MSLFKRIVNEALDEDLKVKRDYIQNVKKAQEEFGSVSVIAPLDSAEKFAIQKAILSLEESINNYSDYREKDIPEFSINTVQTRYNNLALLLQRVGYPNLAQNDMKSVQKSMDSILPTLIELKSEIDASSGSSRVTKDIINGVVMNFKSKTYEPLGIFGFEKSVAPQSPKKKLIRRTFKQLKEPLDELIDAMINNPQASASQENLEQAEQYRELIDSVPYSRDMFNEISEFVRFTTQQLQYELEAM